MRIKNLFVLVLLFCIVFPVTAQQRGGELEPRTSAATVTQGVIRPSGRQWAVFIAIDNYRYASRLAYPVRDAREIMEILRRHYYIDEFIELFNEDATAAGIRRLFSQLIDRTGPNDSVFVFHAGHGITDERTSTGAWIPYDGGEDFYAQTNWVSHVQIRNMLDSLPARHVLLISDSCYSGDLLDATRGAIAASSGFPLAYNIVSRKGMSSGVSEVVPDVSEFASRLKNVLLRTESPYITPEFIISQIRTAQTMRPLTTVPVLAPFPRSGHQLGGSFHFFRRNPRESVPASAANIGEPAASIIPAPRAEAAITRPEAQVIQGEQGFFTGSWIATVEHRMGGDVSFDTYEIVLQANGRATVTLYNDTSRQQTSGNWSYDGNFFRLNAVFRNPSITYQRNIQWVSQVRYISGNNNSFNIIGRAATDGPPVRFTFFRND